MRKTSSVERSLPGRGRMPGIAWPRVSSSFGFQRSYWCAQPPSSRIPSSGPIGRIVRGSSSRLSSGIAPAPSGEKSGPVLPLAGVDVHEHLAHELVRLDGSLDVERDVVAALGARAR